VVFSCNWDGWSCVEDAASAGIQYPATVKIIRVSCLSRIHSGLILKAFEMKADGVMLLGCEPGRCNFGADSNLIQAEYEKTLQIMDLLGIRQERLTLFYSPAFEGKQFVTRLMEFMKQIKTTPSTRRSASKDNKKESTLSQVRS
jgi:coenzyme F420-reducing hydrogenase delta subunit